MGDMMHMSVQNLVWKSWPYVHYCTWNFTLVGERMGYGITETINFMNFGNMFAPYWHISWAIHAEFSRLMDDTMLR